LNFGMFLRKILSTYSRFFYGRYGHDGLNRFISCLALVLCVISFIIPVPFIHIAIFILFAISFLRSLSKNFLKRSSENKIYEKAAKPVKRTIKYWYIRIKNRKTHIIYSCVNCHSILRVPKGAPGRTPGKNPTGTSAENSAGKFAGNPAETPGGNPARTPAGGKIEIKCPKCGAAFIRRIPGL